MSDVPPQDTPQKQCTGPCKQFLPATFEFFRAYKNRSGVVMLRRQCKQCEKEARRKHYHENREKNQKYARKHYHENREKNQKYALNYYYAHREDMIEKSKKYRKTHREKDRRYVQNYYYAHHDESKEKRRIYHQLHRDDLNDNMRKYYQKYYNTEHGKLTCLVNNHKRRSRKRNASGRHTAQELREQLQRQKNLCYYCHKRLDTQWHADHVVPLSRGGSDDISNIVITCQTCNLSKHNKLPHEWPQGNRLF